MNGPSGSPTAQECEDARRCYGGFTPAFQALAKLFEQIAMQPNQLLVL
ncbi:hypothetical protein ABIC60_004845 [Phyllobacterium ifriqiyense]